MATNVSGRIATQIPKFFSHSRQERDFEVRQHLHVQVVMIVEAAHPYIPRLDDASVYIQVAELIHSSFGTHKISVILFMILPHRSVNA